MIFSCWFVMSQKWDKKVLINMNANEKKINGGFRFRSRRAYGVEAAKKNWSTNEEEEGEEGGSCLLLSWWWLRWRCSQVSIKAWGWGGAMPMPLPLPWPASALLMSIILLFHAFAAYIRLIIIAIQQFGLVFHWCLLLHLLLPHKFF